MSFPDPILPAPTPDPDGRRGTPPRMTALPKVYSHSKLMSERMAPTNPYLYAKTPARARSGVARDVVVGRVAGIERVLVGHHSDLVGDPSRTAKVKRVLTASYRGERSDLSHPP